MNRDNRDELIAEYAGRIVDGMDNDTLVSYAFDCMAEALDTLSDEDLAKEVADFYPDLLEQYSA